MQHVRTLVGVLWVDPKAVHDRVRRNHEGVPHLPLGEVALAFVDLEQRARRGELVERDRVRDRRLASNRECGVLGKVGRRDLVLAYSLLEAGLNGGLKVLPEDRVLDLVSLCDVQELLAIFPEDLAASDLLHGCREFTHEVEAWPGTPRRPEGAPPTEEGARAAHELHRAPERDV